MIIHELKEYIERKGSASRSAIAKHFALSIDGVDAMLEVWVRKGKLSRHYHRDEQGKTFEVTYRFVSSQHIPMDIIL